MFAHQARQPACQQRGQQHVGDRDRNLERRHEAQQQREGHPFQGGHLPRLGHAHRGGGHCACSCDAVALPVVRSTAAATISTLIRVRHRKSPGAHTRCRHGRHGSGPASTDSAAQRGSRQGIDRSASVGPNSATMGVRVVAAMCSGPLSPPMYIEARPTRACSSARSNSPTSGTAGASGPRSILAASAMARAAFASDGPDVRTIRLRGSWSHQRRDQGLERFVRPAAEYIARADMDDHERMGVGDPHCGEPRGHPSSGRGIVGHLQRIDRGVGRTDVEWREKIPLVDDRMARRLVRGASHDVRVDPRAARDVVADTRARPARTGEPRGARAAVKVDGNVVLRAPQRHGQGQSPDAGATGLGPSAPR